MSSMLLAVALAAAPHAAPADTVDPALFRAAYERFEGLLVPGRTVLYPANPDTWSEGWTVPTGGALDSLAEVLGVEKGIREDLMECDGQSHCRLQEGVGNIVSIVAAPPRMDGTVRMHVFHTYRAEDPWSGGYVHRAPHRVLEIDFKRGSEGEWIVVRELEGVGGN